MILAALVAAAAFAAEPSGDHSRPAPSLAEPSRAVDAERQSTLAEMRQRRILSSDSQRWAPEDLELLQRMRSAESQGALALLRRRAGGQLSELTAAYRPAGAKSASVRLTREGYDRWLFLRSQDAVELFENKGVDARWVFQLVDLEGKKLFDGSGRLTAQGEDVYARAAANLPAWWKSPVGEVFGTRPPPKAKPPEDPAAVPVTIGPEHPAILDQIYKTNWAMRYEPQLRVTEMGRLRIVTEHDPRGASSGYLVIVRAEKDKETARREFLKRLPDLGAPPDDKIVTLQEKLDAMDAAAKGKYALDRGAVDQELRRLLKGRIAVVWALAGPAPAEAPPAPEPPPSAKNPAPGGPEATAKPVDNGPTPPSAAPPPPEPEQAK